MSEQDMKDLSNTYTPQGDKDAEHLLDVDAVKQTGYEPKARGRRQH